MGEEDLFYECDSWPNISDCYVEYINGEITEIDKSFRLHYIFSKMLRDYPQEAKALQSCASCLCLMDWFRPGSLQEFEGCHIHMEYLRLISFMLDLPKIVVNVKFDHKGMIGQLLSGRECIIRKGNLQPIKD